MTLAHEGREISLARALQWVALERETLMRLLKYSLGLAFAFQLGCDTSAPPPPVETVAAASLSSAQQLQTKKEPVAPTGEKIASRPKPAGYKWGCNKNPSCKANCEWCGINGTCTCRLKGIK